MPVLWLAKSVQDVVQRGVLVDAGQRVQVAFGRFAANLGAAVQVGDATAKRAPGQLAVRVAFLGRYTRKSLTSVEGALGAQHAAQLGKGLVVRPGPPARARAMSGPLVGRLLDAP